MLIIDKLLSVIKMVWPIYKEQEKTMSGIVDRLADIDAQETAEWLEAIEALEE